MAAIGLLLFWTSTKHLVGERLHLYTATVLLLPSLLFWNSGVGKEAPLILGTGAMVAGIFWVAERGRTEVSWVPPAGNDGVAGKDGAFEPPAGAADAVSTVSEMGVVATTSKKAAAQIRTQTARPINDPCIQTIGCPTTTGCPLPTVFIILSLPCVSIDSDLPACLLPSSHP
jgi:hypothetical protein